ncbi:MAG: UDP-N-acetylmuramate--L-alanine ligase [Patescibacteria group bacterium]
MQLSNYQNIYFLGIKGAGMTALAQVLKKMGKNVWGSDIPEVFFTDQVLKKAKIKVLTPFSPKHISDDIDLLVYSTGYTEQNVEFGEAKKKKISMISYPEALGLLFKNHYGIAVCGTHGKTTTTALLGFVLQELGLDPTVIVGSDVPQLGGSARLGQSKYLVIEADEYQNKLQYYTPQAIILTSADWDHPDYFKNQTAYSQVFEDFVRRLPANGLLVAWGDDCKVRDIITATKARVVTYGIEQDNNYHLNQSVELQLIGQHNQLNAAAVLALTDQLGLDQKKVRVALARFKGTKRRFELLGKKKGVAVYDDYAHHPVEIAKTLAAMRAHFGGHKIWAVFQSHTFTRTIALFKDFGRAFGDADQVMVLDIFSSAREIQGKITAADLVKEINKNSANALYVGHITKTAAYLAKKVKPGDIVVTLGAGENWKVGVELLKKI